MKQKLIYLAAIGLLAGCEPNLNAPRIVTRKSVLTDNPCFCNYWIHQDIVTLEMIDSCSKWDLGETIR